MLSLQQFLGFLLAAVAITVTPGPDNMLVLGIGIARGRRQGIAFGLGCALGCLSHTALAVAGVSALLAASAGAFMALKICGGLYLVWLGIDMLRAAGGASVREPEGGRQSAAALFARGVLANAVNPKVVLFFLSFLPQFVIAENGNVGLQMGLLGLVFTAQAALIFGLLGCFAGATGRWLARSPRAGTALDRLAGAIFVGLGLKLLLDD